MSENEYLVCKVKNQLMYTYKFVFVCIFVYMDLYL